MAAVENHSGLPHAWFPKVGAGGHTFDVLIVRGTFELLENGAPAVRATRQPPVVDGDRYDAPRGDDPVRSMLMQAGDRVIYKPGTDVFVTGHARTPGGLPATDWLAGVQLADHLVSLKLYGPRRFVKKWSGWQVTDAAPVTEVPLSYERALGGGYALPLGQSGAIARIHKPDNPVGCGWLPDDTALGALPADERKVLAAAVSGVRDLPAPQIEDPSTPVRSPFQQAQAIGTGPIAPWWVPRAQRQGTLDDAWLSTRYPAVPDDFDGAYYQAAHPRLIIPRHLRGDESLGLTNLLPDSLYVSQLPGWSVMAIATYADGGSAVTLPAIDTVTVDLDTRLLTLVWRASFDRLNPVRALVVGVTDQPFERLEAMPEGRAA